MFQKALFYAVLRVLSINTCAEWSRKDNRIQSSDGRVPADFRSILSERGEDEWKEDPSGSFSRNCPYIPEYPVVQEDDGH